MNTTAEDIHEKIVTQIQGFIEKDGFGFAFIPSQEGAFFGYTIGLYKLGLPELLVSGLDKPTTKTFLGLAYQAFVKDVPAAKETIKSGMLKNVFRTDIKILELPENKVERLNLAKYFTDMDGVEASAVQLIYPDYEGKFPDEKGVNPDFLRVQNPFPELNH
jgi:hypothetical protein